MHFALGLYLSTYTNPFYNTVLPSVKVSPSDHVASLGSNVTFTCEGTGIPTPSITWTRKGGSLPTTHTIENGSLTIINLSVDDQGSYVCTVSNAVGYGEMDTLLRIEGKL